MVLNHRSLAELQAAQRFLVKCIMTSSEGSKGTDKVPLDCKRSVSGLCGRVRVASFQRADTELHMVKLFCQVVQECSGYKRAQGPYAGYSMLCQGLSWCLAPLAPCMAAKLLEPC